LNFTMQGRIMSPRSKSKDSLDDDKAIRQRVLVLYSSNVSVCGIGNWIEVLSEELTRRRWEVIVGLAWGRRFHDPRIVEHSRPALQTVWMDGRTGTEEGRIQAIERSILKVRPHVVVLTCLDSAFEAVRRLRFRGLDFRFLVTNHGNLPQQAACILTHRDIVDMVVCIARLSYQVMSGTPDGFKGERIRHISNAVPPPTAKFVLERTPMRRVGYAGRLEPMKRAADLVPFFQKLSSLRPAAELWVAGSGSLEPEIRSLEAQYPGKVKYFGTMTREELYRAFYPNLDVLVHFSPNEGWGLSIAEAMAHGIVPVVSDFVGIRQEGLVRGGLNGLVFPASDPVAAAMMTNKLLSDADQFTTLRCQATRDIQEKYSVGSFGDAWSAALQACLSLPALPLPERPKSLSRRGRTGIRDPQVEIIRRAMRRRVAHASAGEEWPHFRCFDEALVERVHKFMESISLQP
jgi:glycosyltransferase involved in cell wall biosynthesis